MYGERTMSKLLNQASAGARDARLLREACHRAGQRPDPLARNDGGYVVIKRQMLSLRGARSATKQSPQRRWRLMAKGNAAFWRNEPEDSFWRNEPENADTLARRVSSKALRLLRDQDLLARRRQRRHQDRLRRDRRLRLRQPFGEPPVEVLAAAFVGRRDRLRLAL